MMTVPPYHLFPDPVSEGTFLAGLCAVKFKLKVNVRAYSLQNLQELGLYELPELRTPFHVKAVRVHKITNQFPLSCVYGTHMR
jgi:hypothetical protein